VSKRDFLSRFLKQVSWDQKKKLDKILGTVYKNSSLSAKMSNWENYNCNFRNKNGKRRILLAHSIYYYELI
jgi:hypothetical protein